MPYAFFMIALLLFGLLSTCFFNQIPAKKPLISRSAK